MAYLNSGLRDYVQALNSRGFSYYNLKTESGTFAELMRMGVLFPWGDSFSYHGRAVLLCGDSGMGKTSLARMFKLKNGRKVRILAQDNTTVYWDGRSKPVVYEDPSALDEQRADTPFLEPLLRGKNKGFKLGAIIHLTEGVADASPIQILESNLPGYFVYPLEHEKTPELERIISESMEGVPVFKIGVKSGQYEDKPLSQVYIDILNLLEKLRSQDSSWKAHRWFDWLFNFQYLYKSAKFPTG